MTNYIQYYDQNKKSIMGSDGIVQIVGRKININMIVLSETTENIKSIRSWNEKIKNNTYKGYIKPNNHYMRIFSGSILNPCYITDFIKIVGSETPLNRPDDNED